MEYYPPNPKFMKIQKTNAARLLDAAGISYELIPYESVMSLFHTKSTKTIWLQIM